MELEEKGLYLLSFQSRGGLQVGKFQLRLPRRRKVPMSEFLVFNQELATLLRAGLPLVQSLEILRRRVPKPGFQGRAGRRVRAREIRQRAVRSL
jgi:type IV pilus assembly protein PilC